MIGVNIYTAWLESIFIQHGWSQYLYRMTGVNIHTAWLESTFIQLDWSQYLYNMTGVNIHTAWLWVNIYLIIFSFWMFIKKIPVQHFLKGQHKVIRFYMFCWHSTWPLPWTNDLTFILISYEQVFNILLPLYITWTILTPSPVYPENRIYMFHWPFTWSLYLDIQSASSMFYWTFTWVSCDLRDKCSRFSFIYCSILWSFYNWWGFDCFYRFWCI